MFRFRILILAALMALAGFRDKSTTPYKFPELKYFPKMPVSQQNPVTVEGVNLGRHLFYDPILSSDSSMSCASCHKQKAAFSDSPNSFSAGRNGIPTRRNTLPLFNLAWYPSFFWDGRAASIEDQVFHPVREHDEMNLQWKVAAKRLRKSDRYRGLFIDAFGNDKIDSTKISYAIAQFLRTLISYQSKYDLVLSDKASFTKEEREGFALMNTQTKGDCIHCHSTDAGVLGTTLKFSNNGLESIADPQQYKDKGRGAVTGLLSDNGKFMIPSLRNVALTAPYMHDGRFKTLEEVLDFYSEGVHECANIDSKMEYAYRGGVKLTAQEKQEIIAFLKTLTDSVFITNPEFSNPHK